VTGSARGLGSGFAEKFAKLGCKVACVDLDEELNKETVTAINEKYPESAKAYTCNVALSQEIADLKTAIAKDFGDVNIIVHNAALIAGAKMTEFEDIYVHGVITVNLTSHFLVSTYEVWNIGNYCNFAKIKSTTILDLSRILARYD
jgi:NAD(P)-dependent dehydrogenase (short-subunit alcohol dehydrogenase family)